MVFTAVIVDDHVGLDGFGKHFMLKPLDGSKPIMRAKSSFEMRNKSSFKAPAEV